MDIECAMLELTREYAFHCPVRFHGGRSLFRTGLACSIGTLIWSPDSKTGSIEISGFAVMIAGNSVGSP